MAQAILWIDAEVIEYREIVAKEEASMSLSIMGLGLTLGTSHRDIVSQMHQRRNFMRFVALQACVIGFMMVSAIILLSVDLE
jgi:hypothetical protein